MATTTVLLKNRTQAVRLPEDLRLPEGVKRVDIRAHGCELIISPVGHTWDSFFINGPEVADDFMETREFECVEGLLLSNWVVDDTA